VGHGAGSMGVSLSFLWGMGLIQGPEIGNFCSLKFLGKNAMSELLGKMHGGIACGTIFRSTSGWRHIEHIFYDGKHRNQHIVLFSGHDHIFKSIRRALTWSGGGVASYVLLLK
jgi:hypothetical protein